ncbi:MAG TPA: peptidylprolyl isomerase, partial [Bacteroidales bacterium]
VGLLFSFSLLYSQDEKLADKIVAVIGKSIVLQSDIEQQMLQYKAQRQNIERCEVFENFLMQKMLVNQARIDSIEISEVNVEMSLNNRMDYFLQQAGSQEKLEEYFNMPLNQIKDEMRESIREQMLTQKMQSEITKNIRITPSEVKEFYKSLPPDSIPMIDQQIEYKQILLYPSFAKQSIYETREKLLDIRKRILAGEKFSTLAVLYSEDPGSVTNGGEIGFMSRSELDPAYATAAFNLKPGAVSGIVESQFGFHIIQLIAREGDRVNTRHILIKPKITAKELQLAFNRLDSIARAIKADSITFEKAALIYSEDKTTRFASGQVVNPYTNSTLFELDQLPKEDFYILSKLNVGDISQPFQSKDENRKDAYKIVKLTGKKDPHRANLDDDYLLIQDLALESKKKKYVDEWIENKLSTTYFRIDPTFDCNFKINAWRKKN